MALLKNIYVRERLFRSTNVFFLNGPTPASFLFIFVLFNNNFTEKL